MAAEDEDVAGVGFLFEDRLHLRTQPLIAEPHGVGRTSFDPGGGISWIPFFDFRSRTVQSPAAGRSSRVLSVFSALERDLHWNCCLSSARMFVREASVPFFRTRGCGVNLVFTLHQVAAITARRNVAQTNVAWHRAKQGNACSD
jgi:hypothetical protein